MERLMELLGTKIEKPELKGRDMPIVLQHNGSQNSVLIIDNLATLLTSAGRAPTVSWPPYQSCLTGARGTSPTSWKYRDGFNLFQIQGGDTGGCGPGPGWVD